MTQRDPKVRLLHMRDYERKAIDMAKDRERKDLDDDEMFQLALTRLVEMIGEAAGHFPVESKEKIPSDSMAEDNRNETSANPRI